MYVELQDGDDPGELKRALRYVFGGTDNKLHLKRHVMLLSTRASPEAWSGRHGG